MELTTQDTANLYTPMLKALAGQQATITASNSSETINVETPQDVDFARAVTDPTMNGVATLNFASTESETMGGLPDASRAAELLGELRLPGVASIKYSAGGADQIAGAMHDDVERAAQIAITPDDAAAQERLGTLLAKSYLGTTITVTAPASH